MSDTPETDAAWACFKGYTEPLQDVQDLSRKLEGERDEAREQNAKLRDIAEWAVDNIFHKCTEDLIRAELEELKQLK